MLDDCPSLIKLSDYIRTIHHFHVNLPRLVLVPPDRSTNLVARLAGDLDVEVQHQADDDWQSDTGEPEVTHMRSEFDVRAGLNAIQELALEDAHKASTIVNVTRRCVIAG